MRVITLEDFDSGARLVELPEPAVGANDVLVAVHAASLNAMDSMVAAGALKGMVEHQFPVTVGRDFAGIVHQVGPAVARFAPGDEVMGFVAEMQPLQNGALAEYVARPEDSHIARKPEGLDFVDAAALALAGVTAKQAVDAVDPSDGEQVLVVGATGGVGSFAVQLVAKRGATVIASALPEDEAYMRELGAAETLDYTGDLASAVREAHPDGVEALIDTVSQTDQLAALAELLAPGGRVASPLNAVDEEQFASRNLTGFNVSSATADPTVLSELGELAVAGGLRVPVERRYSLEEATEGLDLFQKGHVRGKLAVVVRA